MQKSDTNNTLPLIELPQITQQWNQQETPKSSEFDIAVSYLKKAPQKRSNNEQAHIFKVMMQISFFRDLRANYGIETAEICCSNLRYKNTQTGQVLFRQGDVGDAFYIIMRGCVSVQVQTVMRVSKQQQDIKSSCIQSAACSPNNKNTSSNNKNSQIHCSSQQEQYPQQQRSPLASPTNISAQQQQSSFASRVQSAMRRMQQSQQPEKQLSSYAQNINESPKEKRFTFVSSQQPLKDTVDDESDEIGEFENVVADKEVKELKTGDSFGELALLQTGKAALRAATILAKQFTHFAYLTATDFQNILRDKEEAKLNENVSFFSKVNLIQGLDDSELRLIFLYCSSRIVSCNEIVYSERDTPEFFYFVESSQVNPSSSISNNNNTNTLDNQITEHKIPQNHPSFRSYNRKIQNQPAPISLVSAGQCFGHLEIVRKYKKRRYSVKCVSSEGLLYLMTATDFMSKIMSNSKSNLRERVKSDVEHKSGLYEDNEKRGFDTRRNHFQFLFQSSSEYQYLSYDQVLKATQCDLKSNRPSILKPIQLLRQLSQDHGQVNSAGCQENEDEQTQFTRLKSHSTNYSYDKQQYQQRQSIFQQQKLQQMQRQSNLQSSPEQLYYPVRSCIPNDASNSNGFRSSFMYPSQQILAQDSLHLSTEQTNQNQADRNILGIDKDIQDGQQFNRHNNQSFGSPLVSTLLNNKTNNSLISRIKSITLSDKTSGSFISDPSKHSPQLNCLNLSGISQQQPFNHSSKESSFRNSNNLRLVKYKTEDSYCTNDQVFNCNNNSQIGSSICSPFLDPRKPEQFYERERQKLEEIKKAQHARAISDIHAKNLAEEQSHIQLQERADQILESINGYKCLKSKLNGIQQAISARGSQDGKVKKSIVFGEFFASVKALHDKKLAERKVKRYEFIDFRKFEEFMDENVYQIHRKLTNHRKSQDIKGKQMKGQQNSKESSQARSLSDNARNKLK